MEENYVPLWRVDCETFKCELAQVSTDSPTGEWIYSWGEPYCYVETEKVGMELLKNVVKEKISQLNNILEELE